MINKSLLSTAHVGVTHNLKWHFTNLDWVNVTITCYYTGFGGYSAHRPLLQTKIIDRINRFCLTLVRGDNCLSCFWLKPVLDCVISAVLLLSITVCDTRTKPWHFDVTNQELAQNVLHREECFNRERNVNSTKVSSEENNLRHGELRVTWQSGLQNCDYLEKQLHHSASLS